MADLKDQNSLLLKDLQKNLLTRGKVAATTESVVESFSESGSGTKPYKFNPEAEKVGIHALLLQQAAAQKDKLKSVPGPKPWEVESQKKKGEVPVDPVDEQAYRKVEIKDNKPKRESKWKTSSMAVLRPFQVRNRIQDGREYHSYYVPKEDKPLQEIATPSSTPIANLKAAFEKKEEPKADPEPSHHSIPEEAVEEVIPKELTEEEKKRAEAARKVAEERQRKAKEAARKAAGEQAARRKKEQEEARAAEEKRKKEEAKFLREDPPECEDSVDGVVYNEKTAIHPPLVVVVPEKTTSGEVLPHSNDPAGYRLQEHYDRPPSQYTVAVPSRFRQRQKDEYFASLGKEPERLRQGDIYITDENWNHWKDPPTDDVLNLGDPQAGYGEQEVLLTSGSPNNSSSFTGSAPSDEPICPLPFDEGPKQGEPQKINLVEQDMIIKGDPQQNKLLEQDMVLKANAVVRGQQPPGKQMTAVEKVALMRRFLSSIYQKKTKKKVTFQTTPPKDNTTRAQQSSLYAQEEENAELLAQFREVYMENEQALQEINKALQSSPDDASLLEQFRQIYMQNEQALQEIAAQTLLPKKTARRLSQEEENADLMEESWEMQNQEAWEEARNTSRPPQSSPYGQEEKADLREEFTEMQQAFQEVTSTTRPQQAAAYQQEEQADLLEEFREIYMQNQQALQEVKNIAGEESSLYQEIKEENKTLVAQFREIYKENEQALQELNYAARPQSAPYQEENPGLLEEFREMQMQNLKALQHSKTSTVPQSSVYQQEENAELLEEFRNIYRQNKQALQEVQHKRAFQETLGPTSSTATQKPTNSTATPQEILIKFLDSEMSRGKREYESVMEQVHEKGMLPSSSLPPPSYVHEEENSHPFDEIEKRENPFPSDFSKPGHVWTWTNAYKAI